MGHPAWWVLVHLVLSVYFDADTCSTQYLCCGSAMFTQAEDFSTSCTSDTPLRVESPHGGSVFVQACWVLQEVLSDTMMALTRPSVTQGKQWPIMAPHLPLWPINFHQAGWERGPAPPSFQPVEVCLPESPLRCHCWQVGRRLLTDVMCVCWRPSSVQHSKYFRSMNQTVQSKLRK